jgi:hypothetical protein
MSAKKWISPELRSAIADAISSRPDVSYQSIAEHFGVSFWAICNIAKQGNIQRRRGWASKAFRSRSAL